MSPADTGGARCFAVGTSVLSIRFDPFYNLPEHRNLTLTLEKSKYGARLLGDRQVVERIVEGRITPGTDSYSEDSSDPVFLRAQNIEEGYLDLTDSKRLSRDAFEKEPKAILKDGDVVFTIDGALLGIAAVHRRIETDCCISNHMVRLVCGERIIPEFLAAFLNSNLGQSQVKRGVTGSAIPGIRTDALARILVPTPPEAIQQRLLLSLDAARDSRKGKLREAENLLAGMDEYVVEELGIEVPKTQTRMTYAVRLSQIREDDRMSPEFFHPERMKAIEAIRRADKATKGSKLAELADFRRDTEKASDAADYVGLASVKSKTGELAFADEVAEGQCFRFEAGDILFARLRPYLNKVWFAERGGVCSTEFHVIRVRPRAEIGVAVLPEYLAAILRSSLIVSQTKHMMTGNTHPRLANDDVVNLVVPVAPIALQESIVKEIGRRRVLARRLHAEAEREWESAKREFERELLGDLAQFDI